MNSNPQVRATLPRVLGPWLATAVVIGTVIGSGVFKKATEVSQNIPEFSMVMLAWVLVGILTLLGALVLAEVAVLLPHAGGNYVFLNQAYGRWAGFLYGWVEFWIVRAGSIAALATVFTEQVDIIFREVRGENLTFWGRQAVIITVILTLAIINARGTRLGSGLQLVVTTVKVASLLGIALLPVLFVLFVSDPPVRISNLSPVEPSGLETFSWSLFGGGLIGIFWAYHGWMNIAPVAEEVTNPHRNIPLALFSGVFAIIALYVSVNFAYYLVIPNRDLPKLSDTTVAVEFTSRLLGPIGLLLASTAVMISVFGALNGNLLVGPRLLFAMGRDGVAPRSLALLHARFQTPTMATAAIACWTVLLVLGVALMQKFTLPVLELGPLELDLNLPKKKAPFDVITDFAMFGAISFDTLAVASIFVLRRRFPKSQVKLAYRCPLFPLLPIVYVCAMAAVLVNMFRTQTTEAIIGLGFICVGAIVYLVGLSRRPS